MSWDRVLQALEASVSEVERALDGGSWDVAAASWEPPAGPLAPPRASERHAWRSFSPARAPPAAASPPRWPESAPSSARAAAGVTAPTAT